MLNSAQGLTALLSPTPSEVRPVAAAGGLLLRFAMDLRYDLSPLAQTGLALLIIGEGWFFTWRSFAHRRLKHVKPLTDRLPFLPGGPQLVFQRTLDAVDECAQWEAGRSAEQWIEGWFLGTPLAKITYANMQQWLAWAFFTKKWKEVEDSEREDIGGMIVELGRRYGWKFAGAFNPEVRPIRLNFDPMHVWGHPLVYYAAAAAVRNAGRMWLKWFLGFTHHKQADGCINYWHYAPPRAATGNSAKLPVVFIHGVGVGISGYVQFVRRLISRAPREYFLLDIPEVAQSGHFEVLPPEAVAASVEDMLKAHGHEKACFVSHSYGTFVMSWIQRSRPGLVAQAVLVDPVCLHLCHPDVAYNFVYRPARSFFLMIVAAFVRRELCSANVLMRHFYWQHNVMWRDELPDNCVVMLSGNDEILNAPLVRQYLSAGRSSGVEVLFFDGYPHASLILSKTAQLQIIERLV